LLELSTITQQFFIMKSPIAVGMLVCLSCLSMVAAFAPINAVSSSRLTNKVPEICMGVFDGDQERKSLTRDSEPEDYFKTYVR
jgi:hypothetical protein